MGSISVEWRRILSWKLTRGKYAPFPGQKSHYWKIDTTKNANYYRNSYVLNFSPIVITMKAMALVRSPTLACGEHLLNGKTKDTPNPKIIIKKESEKVRIIMKWCLPKTGARDLSGGGGFTLNKNVKATFRERLSLPFPHVVLHSLPILN